MSGSIILEWRFCDLLTVKVDFLSSQNLLVATVYTKKSQPCKYCNQHLNEDFCCSEMRGNRSNIVVYELMSYNSFSNE